MIFLPKKLEISSINFNKSKTTPKKIIQTNLAGFYCIKLHKILSTDSLIEGINTYHLLNLLIDNRGCIHQFHNFWSLDYL